MVSSTELGWIVTVISGILDTRRTLPVNETTMTTVTPTAGLATTVASVSSKETTALTFPNNFTVGNWTASLEDLEFIRRLMVARNVIVPLFVAVGLVGNTLSLLVFTRGRFKQMSSSRYLAALAFSDNVFLSTLLLTWLHDFTPVIRSVAACKILVFLSYTSSYLSVCFVVCFTSERYVAVCHPLRAQYLLAKVPRVAVVVLLVGSAVAVYSCSLWTTTAERITTAAETGKAGGDDGSGVGVGGESHGADGNDDGVGVGGEGGVRCMTDMRFLYVLNALTWTDTALTMVLPSTLLVVMNAFIAVAVCRSYALRGAYHHRRHRHHHHHNHHNRQSKGGGGRGGEEEEGEKKKCAVKTGSSGGYHHHHHHHRNHHHQHHHHQHRSGSGLLASERNNIEYSPLAPAHFYSAACPNVHPARASATREESLSSTGSVTSHCGRVSGDVGAANRHNTSKSINNNNNNVDHISDSDNNRRQHPYHRAADSNNSSSSGSSGGGGGDGGVINGGTPPAQPASIAPSPGHKKSSCRPRGEAGTAGKWRAGRQGQVGSRGPALLSKFQLRTTRTLLLVSISFLVLSLPSYVLRLRQLLSVSGGGRTTLQGALVQEVAQLAYYSTYALNFFLYTMYGRHFQQALRELGNRIKHPLGGCRPQWTSSQSQSRALRTSYTLQIGSDSQGHHGSAVTVPQRTRSDLDST